MTSCSSCFLQENRKCIFTIFECLSECLSMLTLYIASLSHRLSVCVYCLSVCLTILPLSGCRLYWQSLWLPLLTVYLWVCLAILTVSLTAYIDCLSDWLRVLTVSACLCWTSVCLLTSTGRTPLLPGTSLQATAVHFQGALPSHVRFGFAIPLIRNSS
jgi:hypothetical protein